MPKLPEFKTEEELVEWFDTHDTSEYIDEMEAPDEEFVFTPTAFTTRAVDLRLRSDLFSAIEHLAERQGIPYQLLIKNWLLEKLSQEAPDLLSHN